MPLMIGLMSGTSADGVTAALVEVRRTPRFAVRTRAWLDRPYPAGLRRRVLAARFGSIPELARLDMELGERFAAAALALLAHARVPARAIAAIGSHGQTVFHDPGRATLQIGAAAVIAERTGLTVVADFRPRDIAAGGQGAPLVPYVDGLLFARAGRRRVALNLGGIANVSVVGGDPAAVCAFDTGPANGLMDAAMRLGGGGRASCDRGGRRAARGRVSEKHLRRLLRHPYLRRPPPKSTGPETFGEELVRPLLAQLSLEDALATLCEFTAASVADALARFVRPEGEFDEVIAGGGGCLNPELMRRLARALAPAALTTCERYGIPVHAKEAVAFAVLAAETLRGRPSNLPSATGARRAVVLGAITPGGPIRGR
ncbi:MAG: anhydro-N-acetylmuramic acid kinase [Planctomycetes bacterium]|nr:anhydro-N-acetylmuramic acid kinase [Planctomycetota bacterium]